MRRPVTVAPRRGGRRRGAGDPRPVSRVPCLSDRALHKAQPPASALKGNSMTRTAHILVAAAISSFVAGAATAQQSVFANEDRVTDALEDLDEDIEDDFDRETLVFGAGDRPLGFSGAISARATATSGNTDTTDIGIGARFGFFDGMNSNDFSLSYTFSEDETEVNEESLLFGYDYRRELGSNLYAFGKGVAVYDEFDAFETDIFIGGGIGYRVFNDARQQLAIQAGPGYRWTEDQTGARTEEVAATISADYSYAFTDTVSVTNDIDVLWSELNTTVTNDFGVNVAMTDSLALRTSLLTEYNTDPLPGFEDTDNTLGVSVVYNF